MKTSHALVKLAALLTVLAALLVTASVTSAASPAQPLARLGGI